MWSALGQRGESVPSKNISQLGVQESDIKHPTAAFSHEPNQAVEAEYDRLRAAARHEAETRGKYLERVSAWCSPFHGLRIVGRSATIASSIDQPIYHISPVPPTQPATASSLAN
jgi:hypothetical protein